MVSFDPANCLNRHFLRICKEAGLGHRQPKDLRDTFVSQLLTAGVSLGYISEQLGHQSVKVTADHYAQWTERGGYREPLPLEAGEVPADLLTRLCDDPQQIRNTWGGGA